MISCNHQVNQAATERQHWDYIVEDTEVDWVEIVKWGVPLFALGEARVRQQSEVVGVLTESKVNDVVNSKL